MEEMNVSTHTTSNLQKKNINVNKKMKGQFYTTDSSYILEGLDGPPEHAAYILEPFAGKGDLIDWVKQMGYTQPIYSYDIDPKRDDIIQQDTILNPPDYSNSWIITNPPYLARNKSASKEVYDIYNTNDLYKCFIESVVNQNNCVGGIFIIPAGFMCSPRDIDVRCRHNFMSKYRITKIKYFEETVFDDTTTTVIAISFEKSDIELTEQYVDWIMMPTNTHKIFYMYSACDWIIGGEIYKVPVPNKITVRRYVQGCTLKLNEQLTYITLTAVDSGKKNGRICLKYTKDYIYPAKECSRTYATLCITGKILSETEQINICSEFNDYIENIRNDTWSLFLPQFRESKEYARKRIPFELAYRIVRYIIYKQLH